MDRSWHIGAAMVAVAALAPATAQAKDLVVSIDSRTMPWSSGANPKFRYGLADGRPPKVIFDSTIRPGIPISFKVTGSTTTVMGGGTFTALGDTSFPQDRGTALFPSHYIKSKKPVFLNQLVGVFISADGSIVGEPFGIGEAAEQRVPDGAVALSLGLNDDRFSDNTGTLKVEIHIGEATVTVEP